MSQDNIMTIKARIAANRIIANLPDKHILPLERLATLFRSHLFLSRKNKCYCDEEENICKLPIIYPIYPSSGETSLGLYNSLPFVYVAWLVPSRALPYIEVIETPIFYKEIIFSEKDKDEIDKSLSPHGKTLIALYKKVTIQELHNEIKGIRQRALLKILEISGYDTHIYLSIFPEMPKLLVEDGVSRYLGNYAERDIEVPWVFQSQRMIPLTFQRRLFVFTLNCWILTKKDLNT